MKRVFWMLLLAGVCLGLMPVLGRAVGTEREQAALQAAVDSRALRRGDRGDQVAALQRLLSSRGFETGPADGVFGPLTEAAVRAAQAQLGLDADGKAGRLTVGGLVDLQELVAHRAEKAQTVVFSSPVPLPNAAAAPLSTAAASVATAATATAVASTDADGLVVYRAGGNAPSATTSKTPTGTPAGQRRVALTFNGSLKATPLDELLAVLARHGATATFYVRGEEAERWPERVARIAAAGHEVGAAGFSYLDMTRLTDSGAQAELIHARNAIREATGTAPVLFRPPMGRYSRKLSVAAERAGLKLVLWSSATVSDEPDLAPAEVAGALARTLADGGVLMLHHDRPVAVETTDILLQQMDKHGYTSVTHSLLLNPAPASRFDNLRTISTNSVERISQQ